MKGPQMNTREKWSAFAVTGSLALMILMALLAVVAVITAGCVPVRPPQPPQPPTQDPPRVLVATVRTPDGAVVQSGTGTLSDDFGHVVPCVWGGDRLTCTPAEIIKAGWQAYLRITDVTDLDPYEQRIPQLPSDAVTDLGEIHLEAAHYNPASVPLEQLARIRGAMWTETWACDLGPRPWQPNNICATDFLWNYSEAQRAALVQNLRSLGYTHAVIGPIVDSDGYHGAWTPNDWRGKFEQFLDMAQYLWDAGLAPVVFIHPDNWTLEQTQQLTPLFQSERAQRLLRIIVPAGWEPTKYEWSNATWTAYMQWGRQTFPNALILLHTVCDVDAPVGTDARGDDNGKPNAEGWVRIAPYLHGWLTQSCTFENPTGYDDPPYSNFENWTRLFNPNVRGSYQDRFRNGYAGWPRGSAWGPTTPLKVYAGEYQAYPVFWQGGKKETARQWGDAAIAQGADGYLDGGSVPVGAGPVPWQR